MQTWFQQRAARLLSGLYIPRFECSAMASDIPLNWFLYFAAASFSIGLVGVLVRRNAIAVLMAIEIMLNAANVNLVAFWRYGKAPPGPGAGQLPGVILALFVITVAAAEVAVGIGMILLCYRRWHAADVDRYDSMSG
jgi:NADH-quinone oxidoreductase subunit K